MRIDPHHLNSKNHQHSDRIAILSKQYNDGWLTVDSNTLNRKDAFEKNKHKIINRETSPMSPFWMQLANHYGKRERENNAAIKNVKATI